MAILVADSGGTKTDWIMIKGADHWQRWKGSGINPYFLDDAAIKSQLATDLVPYTEGQLFERIYFYGAGLAAPAQQARMVAAIRQHHKEAQIIVRSDLEAAAIALCGDQPGIACIIGTGTNACYWDGSQIKAKIPSLGFWLGDEGSGGWLGKQLLTDYSLGDLPQELQFAFQETYGLTLDDILQKLYREPGPNKFAASFTPFLSQHIEGPYCQRLLKEGFRTFVIKYLKRLPHLDRLPIHATGGIAWHFQNMWLPLLELLDLQKGQVLPEVATALANWHAQKG